LLNTISSDNPMGADIAVDQKEIFRFVELQKKKNAAADSTFRLRFGSLEYPHRGSISIIDRAVDPQTGTIKVRLVFPNPQHTLRSGMSATVEVLSITPRTVLIPFKAVTEQLGEFFVYVADSSKVSQRRVLLGKQIGRSVVIAGGLQEGETIVTEGVQNLREGSVITTSSR
jgi:membrane fusion protein (multidrug efflux system)